MGKIRGLMQIRLLPLRRKISRRMRHLWGLQILLGVMETSLVRVQRSTRNCKGRKRNIWSAKERHRKYAWVQVYISVFRIPRHTCRVDHSTNLSSKNDSILTLNKRFAGPDTPCVVRRQRSGAVEEWNSVGETWKWAGSIWGTTFGFSPVRDIKRKLY